MAAAMVEPTPFHLQILEEIIRRGLAIPDPPPYPDGKIETCNICEEPMNWMRPGRVPHHSDCLHKFCKKCWADWIKVQLASGALQIKCPAQKCVLHWEDLKALNDTRNTPAFVMFDESLLFHSITRTPDVVACPRCFVPSFKSGPGCSNTQCGHCQFEFCVTCKLPSHTGDCSRAVDNLSPDELLKYHQERLCQTWKTDNTRKCPQCSIAIEKWTGCSHCRCALCKHEFCWVCLGPYKGRQVSHGSLKCTC